MTFHSHHFGGYPELKPVEFFVAPRVVTSIYDCFCACLREIRWCSYFRGATLNEGIGKTMYSTVARPRGITYHKRTSQTTSLTQRVREPQPSQPALHLRASATKRTSIPCPAGRARDTAQNCAASACCFAAVPCARTHKVLPWCVLGNRYIE